MSKILIIEDDQLVANIYRNKFAVDNFQTEIALDGEVGFALIESFKPDVVILDLMLPKISGVDLLKKIRALPHLQALPVIVFSNTYLSNVVQAAWKAGATKCLSKANCTPKQVLDVVRALIAAPPAAAPAAETPAAAAPVSHETSVIGGESAVETKTDAQFQEELRQSFVTSMPVTLASLRTSLQALIKSATDADRVRFLQELYHKMHSVSGNAGVAGLVLVAQMADAVEALLKELAEKPQSLNSSALRTLASGIDFLGPLVNQTKIRSSEPQEQLKANILVVDDEAISRRAVVHALEKTKLQCTAVEDPTAGLELMGKTRYDLIFLDVDMPGMNGFELCTKLRGLYAHKKTPVIFCTTLNDFESRAHSTMSGGNDLIAKPFLFMELGVKALIHLLRTQPAAIQAVA